MFLQNNGMIKAEKTRGSQIVLNFVMLFSCQFYNPDLIKMKSTAITCLRFCVFAFLLISSFTYPPSVEAQTNINLATHITYPDVMSSVWGFTKGGHEYVLAFRRTGTSIVDITNPAAPVQVYFAAAVVNSDWREGKVWGNYAYITNEGGGGLQIINFSALPSGNITSANVTNWTGGTFNSQTISFTKSHTIWIDENGIGYIYGTNYGNGGAIMVNLAANSTNPPIVGIYNQEYVHDGFVRGDTLWAAQIYEGNFRAINVANKANPVVMATQSTTRTFTHNTWLNNAGTVVFTTDETSNSSVEAYNITDLSDIQLISKFNATGSSAIPHNVHVKNNFLVIAYYRDGVVLADATHPEKMIQVGNYDTSPSYSGSGYNGCWGVYPYFPSGTIAASDIETGLYILTPNYVPASYLKGTITNATTNAPIANVSIQVQGLSSANTTSGFNGGYITGMAGNGTYTVTVSSSGYITQTFTVTFVNGTTQTLNVALVPNIPFSASGTITDAQTGLPVSGASVLFGDGLNNYTATANASGVYTVSLPGSGVYTCYAGKWGYQTLQFTDMNLNPGNSTVNFSLRKGYYDDFLFDYGWPVSGDASAGAWVRAQPIGTTYDNLPSNPDVDVSTDYGTQCYVTGNASGAAGNADVDNGTTILTSPVFDLSTSPNAQISYYRWFRNTGGSGTPNDQMLIKISNGTNTVTIQTLTVSDPNQAQWVPNTFNVSDVITPTNNMRLIVEVSDLGTQHLVEAGLDKFEVTIPPVVFQATAWLSGAFSGLQMNTTLRTNGLLPNQQPYNRPPWNYAGTESLNPLPTNATDWVLVELRPFSNPILITEQRAALILNNGNLADIDGTNGVKFYNLGQGGSYFVVLRHRNHLAVVSDSPVSLPNLSSFSFKTATNVGGGAGQLFLLNAGNYGLIPADFDSNGIITVTDYNYFTTQSGLINTYSDADVTFDGSVTVADFNVFGIYAGKIGMGLVRY